MSELFLRKRIASPLTIDLKVIAGWQLSYLK